MMIFRLLFCPQRCDPFARSGSGAKFPEIEVGRVRKKLHNGCAVQCIEQICSDVFVCCTSQFTFGNRCATSLARAARGRRKVYLTKSRAQKTQTSAYPHAQNAMQTLSNPELKCRTTQLKFSFAFHVAKFGFSAHPSVANLFVFHFERI